jgi:3-oxoacyl-[acyl-carrier-protein] synthase II
VSEDVVITGLGLVTPIGIGTEQVWTSLLSGRSGAGPIRSFDASGYEVSIACEVDDFDATDFISPREVARSDRFCQMAVAAAKMAWDEAGLDRSAVSPDRIGCVIGSGIGGLGTIEEQHSAFVQDGARGVSPFMVPKLMPNAAPAAVAMSLKIHGPNHAVSSACATGAHAIGDAFRALQAGAADVILAGGTEAALTPLSLAAFTRMGALSTRNDEPERASRPFDSQRDGFVFGEGAGVLVLERREVAEKRGAAILARITGYGATCDAHHVTQPDPGGRGAVRAMTLALKEAGAAPEDVDYINAHGTSTPFNDRIESLAIKEAFGVEAKKVPVSSTKSQTGHLLGAAGAVEAAICTLAISRRTIPATINLEEPGEDCDLDYVAGHARAAEVDLAISNSFGFGGQNACLALSSAG